MNRCTGLLLSRWRLEKGSLTPADADFIGRNIAKAQLACGDAVLVGHGRYHWSCQERHRRLTELAQKQGVDCLAEVLHHHEEGTAFKLHPGQTAYLPEALAAKLEEVSALACRCWLWLEGRRLGVPFPDTRAYATSACDKCPGTSPWRNLLLNQRVNGLLAYPPAGSLRHPRQRILHVLPLLLWEPETLTNPELKRRLAAELNLPSDLPAWRDAYLKLWGRVR